MGLNRIGILLSDEELNHPKFDQIYKNNKSNHEIYFLHNKPVYKYEC